MTNFETIAGKLASDGDNSNDGAVAELIDLLLHDSEDKTATSALLSVSQPRHEALKHVRRRGGIYLPGNVEEVQQIVKYALEKHLIVRVAGSSHSAPKAIFANRKSDSIALKLNGDLRNIVEFKEVEEDGGCVAYVKVGAGRNLGVDPSDPESSESNSLTRWLDARGYALPLMGGLSHQTVAGFLLTGSSGGSLQHPRKPVIHEIELVNGNGEIVTLRRGTDDFDAAGVSMGMFGIVTYVTIRVIPRFYVKGTEEFKRFSDSILAPDSNGTVHLAEHLENIEYLHVNWFPQKYVQRVMQWSGTQAPAVGEPDQFDNVLKSNLASVMAALVLKVSSGLIKLDPNSDLFHRIIGALLKQFLPLNSKQTFLGDWYRALPSDDDVPVDSIMKTLFTEIWLPVEQSQAMIEALQELYENQAVAGNFAMEIYGAPSSTFWLSPAYERNVVRADPYYWAHSFGSPESFFQPYWDRLLDLPGARLHWGKYLPQPGCQCGATTFDIEYLHKAYPRMGDWLEKRKIFDPKQIFITDYWRAIFEIR